MRTEQGIIQRTLMMYDVWSITHTIGASLVQRIASLPDTYEAYYDDIESDGGAKSEAKPYEVVNGVAILAIRGPIFKKDDWYVRWTGGASSERMGKIIDMVASDPAVSKVRIDFDSPGGVTAGVNALAEKIADLNKVKQVVAYVEDVCASAAYWLASQCSYIYGSKASALGSIGTYMVLYDYSSMYQKIGVKTIVVSSGKFKGMGEPGAKITSEQIDKFKENVNAVNDIFVSAVRKGRGYTQEAMDLIATGEVWIGTQAKAVGLIDGIKSKDDVMKQMTGEKSAPSYSANGDHKMAKKIPFNLTARLISSLATAMEEEDVELENDDTEEKEETEKKSLGFLARTPKAEQQLLAALTEAGIKTVDQLRATLEFAEQGQQFRQDAIAYATQQAVRLYGAKGTKIAAGLKYASIDDIKSSAEGWEEEADEKWGINGKFGSTRVSQPTALPDDAPQSSSQPGAPSDPDRHTRLLQMTPLGRKAVSTTPNSSKG